MFHKIWSRWSNNYNLVMLFLVMLAFTGMNLWFTHQQAREAKQATCPVWLLIDGVYTTQPPTTPTGLTLQKVVHKLASDCPKDS
jgi:hypothetical protein